MLGLPRADYAEHDAVQSLVRFRDAGVRARPAACCGGLRRVAHFAGDVQTVSEHCIFMEHLSVASCKKVRELCLVEFGRVE